jgi:hypothetical protein
VKLPAYLGIMQRLNMRGAISAGARGSVVVKALCYKPEGRGFDTR